MKSPDNDLGLGKEMTVEEVEANGVVLDHKALFTEQCGVCGCTCGFTHSYAHFGVNRAVSTS